MTRFLLAAILALAAPPAFAGCAEDVQAQMQKVAGLANSGIANAQASPAEQCNAGRAMADETQTLIALYKRCQAELAIADDKIQTLDQQSAQLTQALTTQCGG